MYSRQVRSDRSREETARKVMYVVKKPRIFRLLPMILIALVLSLCSLEGTGRSASAASGATVDVTTLNSEINAASQRFLTGAITTAESDGAQALIIQVNTPGGDISAMQAIMTAELNSTVPIISYVSPAGGFAASAGAFVTLAAPLAAMAPSTTIGASSPVNSDGSNLDSTMQSKVESVLISDMTNIQTRYGRAVEPAVQMVSKAASYGDQQARELGIVDLQASSLNDLLTQIDGRTVTLARGQVTLQTAHADVRNLSQSTLDNLYNIFIDPNVIFLLFIVAVVGIYVEVSHPGMILPGVLGSIALLLFLFGAGTLSPNWAGLALMALAFVLLIMDVRLPTHGVLTVGAVVSLIVGALLFFNSGGPYQGAQVNPLVVYITGGLVGGLGFYVVTMVVRTKRARVSTGTESMIGARVTALTPLLPEGRVSYGGEDWSAVLDPPVLTVDAGSELRVQAVDGLRLHVQLATHTLPPADPAKYSEGA
ncbi:MAG TPA: NfeD family protein [Ktedonobacteraceae bacterium]|nr:NfeD family protein [Ktedonobacteraceae bacterium]